MRTRTMASARANYLTPLGMACVALLMLTSIGLILVQTKQSDPVRAATGAKGASFTFTAAGDYDQTAATTANLHYIAQSGASFHLGLGDFNYNPAVTADQWSTYATGLLPANFPFEIIPGDHDLAQLTNYAADLPDHLGNVQGTYSEQYYFDYPATAPLARFIMFSPYILTQYSYVAGGAGYNWVASTIDAARAAHIPWIVVGMYENCFSLGSLHCSGDDILNLLVSKKVDLILYAHKHNYEASMQLGLNSTTCTALTTTFNPACVVNTGASMSKGAGSAVVMTGTGGASMLPISTSDPALGYFRSWEDSVTGQTFGVSQFTVSANQLAAKFVGTSGGTFSDQFTIATGNPRPTPTQKLSPTATTSATATTSPTPSPTATPGPGVGPLSLSWYFAEGRVGKGFREYLTIGNPAGNPCTVNVDYLYTMDGSSQPSRKTVTVMIPAASRATESVNSDLAIPDSSSAAASLAASLNVDNEASPNCAGVVTERPIYFTNFQGIRSGTDVIGATTLNNTYAFADVPTGSSSSGSYTSYLTILNPNVVTANVTVNYYANGAKVRSQTLAVPAAARGTISPGMVSLPQHVAAVVTADQPIMVERPTYFTGVNGASGAYDVVGVANAAADWLFAEGYTGTGYQENLTLANVDPAKTAQVTITLKSGTGATNATQITLGPQSQTIWNVNQANTFAGSTPEVSAEVTAATSGATIVVQRELYFTYKHTLTNAATGGTDVMGQVGPAAHSVYSFAEGYTNTGYNEWLTLQNPTTKDETIYVTLLSGTGRTSTQTYTVKANSRFTRDVNALVQQVFNPGTSTAGNAVSMTVQTLDGSPFVAERPMYWNTSGVSPFVTLGGSDVIGYVGG